MALVSTPQYDKPDCSDTYRLTRAEKERLAREAASLGLTKQQLFELRMLGEAKPVRQAGRPRKPRVAQQELPIAG